MVIFLIANPSFLVHVHGDLYVIFNDYLYTYFKLLNLNSKNCAYISATILHTKLLRTGGNRLITWERLILLFCI
jgi:hypothetical protein